MASGAVTLSQIRAGRVLERVVVRLVRFWAFRNGTSGGEIVAMNLLLVDEESTLAHATVNLAFVPMFQPLLRDGSVYVICNFDAGHISSHYRLSDFHLNLRFNDSTSLTAVVEPVPQIPEQVFRFRSHAEMETLAICNTDLPDVIGQIRSIRTFRDGITDDLIKVLLVLQLQGQQQVRLIASDGHASLLEKLLSNNSSDFYVLLATNVNPRMFAGKLHVNATAGTRFFFDDELDATRDFVKSIDPVKSVAKYKTVQIVEHVSLAYLNNFILTSNPQDIECICSAKVIAIQARRGWSFVSCSECGRKMQMRGPSFCCTTCSGPAAGGEVKYRVEMVVEDSSSRAVFVVYDAEMEELTGIGASELTSQMTNGVKVSSDTDKLPPVITDLIGSTFTFHLRLSTFNFSAYHESFTVSRVSSDAKVMAKQDVSEVRPMSADSCVKDSAGEATLGSTSGLALSMKKKKPKLF